MSLLTLASRVAGLVRELLVAALFGASATTDAFNVAFRIPNLLRRLFAEGAFSQAFVPVLAATKETEGFDATHILVNRVATVLVWTLLATCLVGVIGAPWLVWAMASGLQQSGTGFDTAVVLTRWMFPYIAFMSLVALAAGILNTWKHFWVPAATPELLNLAMIVGAWIGAPWLAARGYEPIYGLAAGVMVGGVLQLAIQIPTLRRIGMLPRIGLHPGAVRAAWKDPGTRRILSLMAPALLGVSVAQISLLINTQIASHLATGSVSWLTYADRLMEFPTALLGVAMGVVLLPQLASAKAQGDHAAYSGLLDWGLRLVFVFSAPCALALLVIAEPLVATLYNYGRFTASDVSQTATALAGYGIGLVGLVAIKILAPGYFANQDTKTPVKIAIFVLILTQCLNVLLVPYLAHAGLAVAIGLGALVNAFCLWFGLARRGVLQHGHGWGGLLGRVALGCLALLAWLLWSRGWISWLDGTVYWATRAATLGLICVGGAVIYLGCLAVLGVPLKAMMRRKAVVSRLDQTRQGVSED